MRFYKKIRVFQNSDNTYVNGQQKQLMAPDSLPQAVSEILPNIRFCTLLEGRHLQREFLKLDTNNRYGSIFSKTSYTKITNFEKNNWINKMNLLTDEPNINHKLGESVFF